MSARSNTIITSKTLREIWVRRDDGGLECKPWLVFEITLPDSAQKKIRAFLDKEASRTQNYNNRSPSPDEMRETASFYGDLVNAPDTVPPRLIAIDELTLERIPTELTKINWYTLGDSVGGISAGKPRSHNEGLSNVVSSEEQDVLFSPGLLCRIPIEYNGDRRYIFQLGEKNLRVKGQAFYKPIGGHLKYIEGFRQYLGAFDLKLKGSLMPQDVGDVAFFVNKFHFFDLRNIFLNEINRNDSSVLMRPEKILAEELLEELGPVTASDGISLLTSEELEIHDSEGG